MKVLIVKLSAFGDIIHTLPALDDLLSRPEISEVHWLIDQRFAFISDIFPPQVKVHKVALKGEQRIHHAWQMIQTLRKENFDIILDLQGLIKSGILVWASAKPHSKTYGFDRKQSPEWPNRWFVTPVPFHPEEKHVVQKYRHIAAAPFEKSHANNNNPIPYKPPHISIGPISESGLQQQTGLNLHQQAYTVLHVGGAWKTKQLPEATWKEMILILEKEHSQAIIAWGNDQEHALAKRITHGSDARVLPDRLDMSTLCQFLQQAQAVIGMDTGVLHLAAALGTPTVTMWGPSASWNSAPLGTLHRHVESNPECGPCFKRQCDNFICLPSLRSEQIIQKWLEVRK